MVLHPHPQMVLQPHPQMVPQPHPQLRPQLFPVHLHLDEFSPVPNQLESTTVSAATPKAVECELALM